MSLGEIVVWVPEPFDMGAGIITGVNEIGWIEVCNVPTAYFALNYAPAPRTPYGARIAIAQRILRDEGVLP